jgi:aminotransferase
MITCGANQAFVNGLLAATNPGDEIIVFAPYYFDHVFAIRLAGCVPIAVDLALDADDGYRIDFHGLRKALSGRTRAVVLVSPGNPTGRVAAPAEVEALCNLCREAELWLFSDETYDLLTFAPAAHISPAALPTACPKRTIVLGSFSKTFALAAWRVGYLYADDAFIEETIKVQDALVVCAAVPSQLAALGALEATDTYVPAALAALARRRDALLSLLTDSRTLDPIAPQGATSTLARITTPHFETAFDYSKRLLAQAGLITVPGSAFGPRGEGHLRLSFGNQPPKTIKQAGERLRRFESTLC